MSDANPPATGSIVWHDLSVEHADEIADFYAKVVGWKPTPVSMGDYNDFNLDQPETGETAAGVCHARGSNAGLPAQWLMYVKVEDADLSANQCKDLGGKVLSGPNKVGEQTYYTLQDPAGAIIAIFS